MKKNIKKVKENENNDDDYETDDNHEWIGVPRVRIPRVKS